MAINPDVVRRSIETLNHARPELRRLCERESVRLASCGDPVGAECISVLGALIEKVSDDMQKELARHIRQEYPG